MEVKIILSDNWIVGNLQNALDTWNGRLSEIWNLVLQTPEDFKGGAIWNTILNIHGALQAIALALLVIFFISGVIKTCGSFAELRKPEHAVKLFVRFGIAHMIVTYGLDLMIAIFSIVQGITKTIMQSVMFENNATAILPSELIETIENIGFFESIPLWAITLIGGILVTVLSFIMILSVYGRFFKLYIYTAISPIPLSSIAGEPTQNVGKTFIKSYISVCMEGAIIVLACIIFSLFASSTPTIDVNAPAVTQVWTYIAELVFNMLVLVGTIKLSDRVVKEMMGL